MALFNKFILVSENNSMSGVSKCFEVGVSNWMREYVAVTSYSVACLLRSDCYDQVAGRTPAVAGLL